MSRESCDMHVTISMGSHDMHVGDVRREMMTGCHPTIDVV